MVDVSRVSINCYYQALNREHTKSNNIKHEYSLGAQEHVGN